MKQAQFEVKKAHNGQFHFILRAKNGKVVLQSEMYDSKQAASRGVHSIVKIVQKGEFKIVDKVKDKK
ncbi:MAG: YegP family protein [Candidatus Anammoxibacter sp.]